MAAVVTTEHNQRVGIDGQGLQQREEFTDLIIEILHHGSIAGDGIDHFWARLIIACAIATDLAVELRKYLAPFLVQLFRRVHRRVRNRHWHVAEERLLLLSVLFDEGECLLHHHIVDVGALRHINQLTVFDHMYGKVGMGRALRFPAVEHIESMTQRIFIGLCVCGSQSPFAIHPGGVASVLEYLRQGRHLRI